MQFVRLFSGRSWNTLDDFPSSSSEQLFTWESSAIFSSGDLILIIRLSSSLSQDFGVLEMLFGKHRLTVTRDVWIKCFRESDDVNYRSLWNALQTKQGSSFLELSIMGVTWFRYCLRLFYRTLRKDEVIQRDVCFSFRCFLLHHRWDKTTEKGLW